MSKGQRNIAGVDVGTECVKAVIIDGEGTILGRAVVKTRGYFEERAREVLDASLDDAQLTESDLDTICATGFGARLVPGATRSYGEAICHARGAYRHHPSAMTVVSIGGQEPRVIQVSDEGRPSEIAALRQCAVGIGTFLMYAARHLDVHPTQLQELAAAADHPAHVGSYCSVFAGGELLERLREGASREEVALGCIHSVAERVAEIGGFGEAIKVTGGVAEYFPGILTSLSTLTGLSVEVVPEAMLCAAAGAALMAGEEIGLDPESKKQSGSA
jgi:(R)-2-hydroxyacyl-CoA dehydratese activating ATPase